ncbi:MAG: ATP-binding cassette domain-containing protein [Nitriliruptor sp.]
MPAVVTESLTRRFGDTVALAGVDLEIAEGEVLGLLGPNGAGKTTLVRILATLLPPSGGHATVLGHDVASDPASVRREIGLTGQYAAIDGLLTGRENLRMFGELFHLSTRDARRRADELLERFDLVEAADRRAGGYSGGMRRRLDLASSLLVRPRLLFLDEPTTGLDPRSRNAIWQVTRELVAEGTTLLLTTQYLEEADQLADRIAVIDHGRIIAEGTGDELKDQVGGQVVEVRLEDRTQLAAAVAAVLGAETLGVDRVRVHVAGADPLAVLGEVARQLGAADIAVREAALARPTLDDVFLDLTGHPAPGPEDPALALEGDGGAVPASDDQDVA